MLGDVHIVAHHKAGIGFVLHLEEITAGGLHGDGGAPGHGENTCRAGGGALAQVDPCVGGGLVGIGGGGISGGIGEHGGIGGAGLRRHGGGGQGGRLLGQGAVDTGLGLGAHLAVYLELLRRLEGAHGLLCAGAVDAINGAGQVAQLLQLLLHGADSPAPVAGAQGEAGDGRLVAHLGGPAGGVQGLALVQQLLGDGIGNAVFGQLVLGLQGFHRLGGAPAKLAVNAALVVVELLEGALQNADHFAAAAISERRVLGAQRAVSRLGGGRNSAGIQGAAADLAGQHIALVAGVLHNEIAAIRAIDRQGIPLGNGQQKSTVSRRLAAQRQALGGVADKGEALCPQRRQRAYHHQGAQKEDEGSLPSE